MKDEKFSFFAPPPKVPKTPSVAWEFQDLVKVEDGSDSDQPADPVGGFSRKAELDQLAKAATTSAEGIDLTKVILADADVRDRELASVTLRKPTGLSTVKRDAGTMVMFAGTPMRT